MSKIRSEKLTEEEKERRKIIEEILQTNAELKHRLKRDIKTFNENFRKFSNEGEKEVDKVKKIVDILSKEVKEMLNKNQNLKKFYGESRYVVFSEDLKDDEHQGSLMTQIGTIVIAFSTLCLTASGYLLYIFIIRSTRVSEAFNTITLIPFIIIASIILVGTFVIQYYQIFSSLSEYKKVRAEKIELANILYSIETDVIEILSFSKEDKEISEILENLELRNKPLWKKYDAVISNVLYKSINLKS